MLKLITYSLIWINIWTQINVFEMYHAALLCPDFHRSVGALTRREETKNRRHRPQGLGYCLGPVGWDR